MRTIYNIAINWLDVTMTSRMKIGLLVSRWPAMFLFKKTKVKDSQSMRKLSGQSRTGKKTFLIFVVLSKLCNYQSKMWKFLLRLATYYQQKLVLSKLLFLTWMKPWFIAAWYLLITTSTRLSYTHTSPVMAQQFLTY
jgi:hypothetical protein